LLRDESRLPLYIKAKHYLLDLISAGEFPPGSRLPTEHELMNTLNMGRATVRAALSELERDGVITKKHGIGTFVREQKNAFSFEPLVSLSYSLKRMGLDIVNKVLICETVKPEQELLKGWSKTDKVGHLKRLRLAADKPVAIEDSYFPEFIFNTIKQLDTSESVAHALLSYPGIDINKIDLSVIVREPDKIEREQLALETADRVAEMTRWIYASPGDRAVNYIRFVLPEKLMNTAIWENKQY
jgi:GntR family transcriptional regulator